MKKEDLERLGKQTPARMATYTALNSTKLICVEPDLGFANLCGLFYANLRRANLRGLVSMEPICLSWMGQIWGTDLGGTQLFSTESRQGYLQFV